MGSCPLKAEIYIHEEDPLSIMLICFVGNYHFLTPQAAEPDSLSPSVGMRLALLGFLFWGPRGKSFITAFLLTDTETIRHPNCSRH